MKGQIPIPYIIGLLLGIVVVAILGYWFFVLGGRIPGQVTESWCSVKKQKYCREWSICDFGTVCKPGRWRDYAPGCEGIGIGAPDKTECSKLLIGLKPMGAPCDSDEECLSGFCNRTSGVCE
jgi:hypothetical protein